jgi:selenocysteine lyase/cysteine desulfurase
MTDQTSIPIDFVRQQFPSLAGDWTFFDNAGGSQTLKQVVQRISEYLLTSDVQLGASYAVSQLAGDRVATHEDVIGDRLLKYLTSKSNIRIIGQPQANRNSRVPTISFVVDGMNSESIPLQIDKHNIGIRFGDFYAKRLIEDLGLDKQGGVVRVSMVHYNTIEEVDRLIQALETVL